MNSASYPTLGSLMKLSDAETRSVSAENVYGEKGKGGMAEPGKPQPEVTRIGQHWEVGANARDLGQGWKVRPSIVLPGMSTSTLMDVEGPGIIQHIWITVRGNRELILRIYWDDEETPSVESPLVDFFCNGWNVRTPIVALPINVNPTGGFNCYFPMPFRARARVTIENRGSVPAKAFYYTINYALMNVAPEDAYFHAQFRRTNPSVPKVDHTILDDVKGKGHYVGTYMAWQQNCGGWWGEGEFKAFLDDDGEFPTICGTGTEDYFGGAWCFGSNYSAPFMGYPLGSSDRKPGNRHILYRFHVLDPIRFEKNIRVTMQALGDGAQHIPLCDDISSVAYWYQAEPHAPFPRLGDREAVEIV